MTRQQAKNRVRGGRAWARMGRCAGLVPVSYEMEWEGVTIPVRVEVRDGLTVAVPPSGQAFPVTACPGAVWRRQQAANSEETP